MYSRTHTHGTQVALLESERASLRAVADEVVEEQRRLDEQKEASQRQAADAERAAERAHRMLQVRAR